MKVVFVHKPQTVNLACVCPIMKPDGDDSMNSLGRLSTDQSRGKNILKGTTKILALHAQVRVKLTKKVAWIPHRIHDGYLKLFCPPRHCIHLIVSGGAKGSTWAFIVGYRRETRPSISWRFNNDFVSGLSHFFGTLIGTEYQGCFADTLVIGYCDYLGTLVIRQKLS